mgnify:CR=1 FL=1
MGRLSAAAMALLDAPARDLPPAPTPQIQTSSDASPTNPRRGNKPSMPSYQSIDDYRGEISAFIVWYCSDGILRSDDEIFNAVFDELPFGRRGRKIVERINSEIYALRASGRIA